MLSLLALGVSGYLGQGLAVQRDRIAANDTIFRRQRRFLGSDFKPLVTAFDGDIDDQDASARMTTLAGSAIADLMRQTSAAAIGGRCHAAIITPPPCLAEGLTPDSLHNTAAAVAAMLPVTAAGRRLYMMGGAGLGLALQDFFRGTGPDGRLLVVMADSYRCRTRLNALLSAGRLFSGTHRYGLIPGEAAVAALFAPCDPGDPGHPGEGLARIAGVATEIEPLPEGVDGDTGFPALSTACRSALGAGPPATHWFSDWNNARYRASELSYARLRLSDRLADDMQITHLPLIFGDTGAAGPGLALGLALDPALPHPGPCLVSAGTYGRGERSALVVVPPPAR